MHSIDQCGEGESSGPLPDRGYAVTVRELCEFAAKAGDLDRRFTPSPTASEGVAGHQAVTARRGPARKAEVRLSGAFENLSVRGRADGYDADARVLEEVKTFKGDLDCIPANHTALHWAQAKIYGCLLCERYGLRELTVALIYFEVGSEKEFPLTELCRADDLKRVFDTLCARFLSWATQEIDHRLARDQDLSALAFPHAGFRTGQRALAVNVFKAAQLGRALMAQAPTGIGKTIGVLFPLLKAAPVERIDKVFFLTAKNSGRAVALDALDALRRNGPSSSLRVVELVARDKVCEHPDKDCHGDSCPLAKGFYDRLPEARKAAVALGALTRETVREVASAHGVCPYYLSQELVRWADVVVGDYNHYFDRDALLHGMTVANGWRVVVVADEAHNLIDRARAMYSAQLAEVTLREVSRDAPHAPKKSLSKAARAWRTLTKDRSDEYQAHRELPQKFVAAIRSLTVDITACLEADGEEATPSLLCLYFDALRFIQLSESCGTHSLFDVSRAVAVSGARRASHSVCIRNVVPAHFLKERFEAAHASILLSATLSPHRFYSDTLGLPETTAWLDVEAPFKAEQLSVRIVRDVSTRYSRRAESLAPIAEIIARQFAAEAGNYLAFFSSFDYMLLAHAELARRHPSIPSWHQERGMNDSARTEFLARFQEGGAGVAFAVLGGSFAEGIDLPGTRLIGAFIATLGMPQFNAVNEEFRRCTEAAFGEGFNYTYLYPGIRKIVQAAGRVIRTPTDRGHIVLIDDRFARAEVMSLLPSWWSIECDQGRRRLPADG